MIAKLVREALADKEAAMEALLAKLDESLQARDDESARLRSDLAALKEDFLYNLQLLQDRDAELASYEAAVAALKSDLLERDAQLSELRIHISDVTSELASAKSSALLQEQQQDEILKRLRREHEAASQAADEQQRKEKEEREKLELIMSIKVQSLEQELEEIRYAERVLKEKYWAVTDEHKAAVVRIAELEALNNKLEAEMDRLRYLADAQSAETERDAQCKQKALDIENQQLREELHRQSEATLVLDDLRKEDQRAFAEELHIMRSEAAEKDDCLNALTADLAAAQQRIISLEEGYREDIEKLHAHAKQSKSNLKAKYKKSISTLHQELLSLKARSSEQFQLVDELKHALIDKDQVMKQLESEIVHRANTEAGLRHELIEVSLHNEKRMAEMAVSKEKESANFIRSLLKEKEELEAEVKLLRGLHSKQSVDNSSQTTDADSNEMERLLSELTGRAAELEQENESLRALVRQMREEMERVSAEAVGPQRNYFYQEALSANEQVQQLSVLLAKKQSLIDSLLSEKAETPKQTGEVDAQFKLNEVISDLRRRCNQAAAENATLKAERVKLIDISNFLRAELREAVKPLHQSATVGTQTLVRRSASTDPTPQIVQQRAPTLEQQKRPPARTAASFGSNRTPSPDKAMEEEKARRARGLRNWNVKEDI